MTIQDLSVCKGVIIPQINTFMRQLMINQRDFGIPYFQRKKKPIQKETNHDDIERFRANTEHLESSPIFQTTIPYGSSRTLGSGTGVSGYISTFSDSHGSMGIDVASSSSSRKARADANAADQHGQTAFFFASEPSASMVHGVWSRGSLVGTRWKHREMTENLGKKNMKVLERTNWETNT